jgi:glyceraldehyde-3-phosphate dehydrogenase (NADP+)
MLLKNLYPFILGGEEKYNENKKEVRDPYKDEIFAEICYAEEEEMEKAITLSQKAFSQMKELPTYERINILKNISKRLKEDKKLIEELTFMMVKESGKPISYVRAEIERCSFVFDMASSDIRRFNGEYMELDLLPFAKGKFAIVKRFPIGPIYAITPFNFPINLFAHKVAPAIAVGNPIIWKPAPQTPISAIIFGKMIAEEVGIEGFISVLPLEIPLAEKLVKDERIKMLSFTGSDKVGWYLRDIARKKKVLLELGGNAACIVEPDGDIETAIKKIVIGAFANAGQVCISVQRVMLHQDIYEKAKELILEESKKVKAGDPFLDDVVVGPMIDLSAIERAKSWINKAIKAGANLLLGGEVSEKTILLPTILENVPSGLEVSCREVFAPIMVLYKYKNLKEAVELVNDSIYGLQAGIFTKDIEKIIYAYNYIDVGGLLVNEIPTFRIDHYPYGGIKDSGVGREGILSTMEEMTEPKVLIIQKTGI